MAIKPELTQLQLAAMHAILYRKRLKTLLPDIGDPPNKARVAAVLFKAVGLPPSEFRQMNAGQLIPFVDLAIEAMSPATPRAPSVTAEPHTNVADNAKKSRKQLPDSPDVRDLCAKLSKRKDGSVLMDIARRLTREPKGDCPKADKLMRQARRFRELWE